MAKRKPNIEDLTSWYNFNLDINNRTIYFGPWQPNEEMVADDKSWEVNDWSAQNIIKGLTLLENYNHDPINITWFSYGGDWDAGMAIYDYIRMCKSHVTMTCYGRVRSMGTIIIQACDERILSPNCMYLIHYGDFAVDGTSKDVIAASEEAKLNNTTMENIYLDVIKERKPKYTRKQLQDFMKYDRYMTAQEAVDMGLADRVLN